MFRQSGHPRSFHGVAYIPQLVPNGLANAEQAFQIAPSNPAVLQELQVGYYLLSSLLDGSGDYEAAAEYLQRNCRSLRHACEPRLTIEF